MTILFKVFLFFTGLRFNQIATMDLNCDDTKFSFCKINIDGGVDLNVVLISEENNFTNSSEENYEINFTIVPIDRYEGIIEQINLAYESDNETWRDDLPKEFYENPENVQKIQLEFQSLTKIKSSAFVDAVNLVEIDLDNNQILYIGEDAFVDLTNLTILSLTKNNLTAIRSNTFLGAIQLKRLHLNQNKIETIEDGAFNLRNLENILLQNNRLKRLSSALFLGAPQLIEAVFEENDLVHIGDAFSHLHRLRILILDYNQIEDISIRKLAHLSELNHLSLRKSGFRLIKDKINDDAAVAKGNFSSKLEVLDLAENNIADGDTIMQQLRLFQRIEILNLEYNELTHLNDAHQIKKWFPYLEILNLAYNPLKCNWIENNVEFLKIRDLKVFPWVNSPYGCIPDE